MNKPPGGWVGYRCERTSPHGCLGFFVDPATVEPSIRRKPLERHDNGPAPRGCARVGNCASALHSQRLRKASLYWPVHLNWYRRPRPPPRGGRSSGLTLVSAVRQRGSIGRSGVSFRHHEAMPNSPGPLLKVAWRHSLVRCGFDATPHAARASWPRRATWLATICGQGQGEGPDRSVL